MIFLNYDDLKRISYFITKCRKVINSFHELWKYITPVDNLLNHFCLFWFSYLVLFFFFCFVLLWVFLEGGGYFFFLFSILSYQRSKVQRALQSLSYLAHNVPLSSSDTTDKNIMGVSGLCIINFYLFNFEGNSVNL